MEKITVGIDVSKDRLDVAVRQVVKILPSRALVPGSTTS
jgi:hypothetical protein